MGGTPCLTVRRMFRGEVNLGGTKRVRECTWESSQMTNKQGSVFAQADECLGVGGPGWGEAGEA